MLFTPDHIEIQDIENEILSIDQIANVHHVHIWQLNDHDIHFEAHIEFKRDIALSEFDGICKSIEDMLFDKFKIKHSNLQPEFERDDQKELIIQD